jgi:hypothetical protein
VTAPMTDEERARDLWLALRTTYFINATTRITKVLSAVRSSQKEADARIAETYADEQGRVAILKMADDLPASCWEHQASAALGRMFAKAIRSTP